jgi:hypothetical protein
MKLPFLFSCMHSSFTRTRTVEAVGCQACSRCNFKGTDELCKTVLRKQHSRPCTGCSCVRSCGASIALPECWAARCTPSAFSCVGLRKSSACEACFRQDTCSECSPVWHLNDCCSLAWQWFALPFQDSSFCVSSCTLSWRLLLFSPFISHMHLRLLWRWKQLLGVQRCIARYTCMSGTDAVVHVVAWNEHCTLLRAAIGSKQSRERFQMLSHKTLWASCYLHAISSCHG